MSRQSETHPSLVVCPFRVAYFEHLVPRLFTTSLPCVSRGDAPRSPCSCDACMRHPPCKWRRCSQRGARCVSLARVACAQIPGCQAGLLHSYGARGRLERSRRGCWTVHYRSSVDMSLLKYGTQDSSNSKGVPRRRRSVVGWTARTLDDDSKIQNRVCCLVRIPWSS